jgi:hypothetical protein
MIAHRYVPAICVLLALALVPTLIHSYSDYRPQDGHTAAALSTTLAGFSSTPTTRGAMWGKRRFDSDDWMERTYQDGRRDVRLTVVRSYDPKRLYHHPELAIADGTGFAGVHIVHPKQRVDMPVHALTPAAGVDAAAAYVLHYGGRFVDDPILFQLRTAGELLVTPRQPMTLFFAIEHNLSDRGSAATAVVDVLIAAVDDFLAQTPAASAGK